MTTTIHHWIGGRPTALTATRTAVVHDPATGAVTGEVPLAGRADVDTAVASAKEAAAQWREASLSRRAAVLFAFRELLHAHADELAAIVTAEHGKVLADAAGEVARGLENVEFATSLPQLLKGGYSEQVSTGVDVYSLRQPLGVVAGITPFNFPAMVPMWMYPVAIACGNTFVLKPSERDPSAPMSIRGSACRQPSAAPSVRDSHDSVSPGDVPRACVTAERFRPRRGSVRTRSVGGTGSTTDHPATGDPSRSTR